MQSIKLSKDKSMSRRATSYFLILGMLFCAVIGYVSHTHDSSLSHNASSDCIACKFQGTGKYLTQRDNFALPVIVAESEIITSCVYNLAEHSLGASVIRPPPVG
jgi:hypothetical protein